MVYWKGGLLRIGRFGGAETAADCNGKEARMAGLEGLHGKASRLSMLAVGLAVILACCLTAGLSGCSCSSDQGKQDNKQAEQKKEPVKEPEKEKKVEDKAVPNVVGMTKDDAQRVVADAGFKVGAVSEEESAEVAAGMVLKQSQKAAEQASAGSTVDLVISKGVKKDPVQTTVPDLTGMTQTQAEDALAKANLVPKAGDPVFKDGVGAGKVFSQSVAAGASVEEGTTVGFIAALSKEVAAVPSVVGLAKDAAASTLANAGFNVDTVEAYNASVAGTKVDRGTTVNLTLEEPYTQGTTEGEAL